MPAIIEANRLTATNQETLEWYLCGTISDGERTRELVISKARFTTGRRSTCDLRLGWQTVSGLHAEFITIGKILCLRDLGSTNGTFVNGRRINTDTILSDGDIVQFGRAEFRVGSRSEDDAGGTVNWNGVGLPSRLIGFEELISGNGLVPHYQPIVKFSDASTVGFEVLARSRIPEFPTPREMFETAAQLDQEQELSEASRFFGVEKGFGMPADQTLYLNTHPTELQGDRLIRSLERLRDSAPNQSLSLEIHEAAVTDLDAMAQLDRHGCWTWSKCRRTFWSSTFRSCETSITLHQSDTGWSVCWWKWCGTSESHRLPKASKPRQKQRHACSSDSNWLKDSTSAAPPPTGEKLRLSSACSVTELCRIEFQSRVCVPQNTPPGGKSRINDRRVFRHLSDPVDGEIRT